jgi:hypothetical protein
MIWTPNGPTRITEASTGFLQERYFAEGDNRPDLKEKIEREVKRRGMTLDEFLAYGQSTRKRLPVTELPRGLLPSSRKKLSYQEMENMN